MPLDNWSEMRLFHTLTSMRGDELFKRESSYETDSLLNGFGNYWHHWEKISLLEKESPNAVESYSTYS